eukprot:SAG31_NODE_260_length_18915_cov_3.432823_13_plen_57_part_00
MHRLQLKAWNPTLLPLTAPRRFFRASLVDTFAVKLMCIFLSLHKTRVCLQSLGLEQ